MKVISTLSTCAVITVIFLMMYAGVQQTYRSGANDPQIQIARDIARELREGETIEHIFPRDSFDISKSLSSFAVVYDSSSKPLRSSGFLNGTPPQLPPGVFDFVKSHGEDMVTWQPHRGVRMAMVLCFVQSPNVRFVAVGRSLREIEIRENNLVSMVLGGWLVCIGIIIMSALIQLKFKKQ
ncbi:MAG TPA: hypothetical protein VNV85_05675 [Puia sp.]|jgi:hypothetical protein|nr:hypothetical protein [Puia sp.]